jgi:hypothetical protein
MEAQMGRKLKMAQQKERIRAKAEASVLRRQMEQAQAATSAQQPLQDSLSTDEELLKLFNSGEKIEKTPRGANNQKSNNSNKKKKGKK